MKTAKIGGKEVSLLALGASEFGGLCPEAQAFDFMDAYFELGGNFIDTAHIYGDFVTPKNGESERVIGRWMAQRHNRNLVFLSTKGAHPAFHTMTIGRLSREEIRNDMLESLEALGCDCVDIYWLHRDDTSRSVGDIMETLQSLIDDGYTMLVGASNWSPARIREANAYAVAHGLTPFSANQPQFSLARQMTVEDPTLYPMDAETWKLHAETQMPCIPFSSQGKGFFTKLDTLGADDLPDKARRRFLYPENTEVYERMKIIREQTGLSIGAIALAWLTSQPFPVFPLVGASRMEHIKALKEAGDASITPEQRDFLRKLW